MNHHSCRHYHGCPVFASDGMFLLQASQIEPFYCKKHDKIMGSCKWCPTCPRCGGDMALDYIMMYLRLEVSMVCVQCSHRVPSELRVVEPREVGIQEKADDACRVEWCSRRAYEHFKVTLGGAAWEICAFHRDRVMNWGYRHLPAERYPLVLNDGLLKDNPQYLSARKKGENISVEVLNILQRIQAAMDRGVTYTGRGQRGVDKRLKQIAADGLISKLLNGWVLTDAGLAEVEKK